MTVRVSKELRINGVLGTCKSLKDNTLKTASDMEIGEGLTNAWYLGGISPNAALCLMVSLSEANASENKERVLVGGRRPETFRPSRPSNGPTTSSAPGCRP